MRNIVPIESFDWDSFLEETLKNLQAVTTGEHLVIRQVDKQIEHPELGWQSHDLPDTLREPESSLFVYFAVDNLDNAVILADGTKYLYADPNDISLDDEDTFDDALDEAEQHMSETKHEAVGYIFERQGNDLLISSGWFVGGSINNPAFIERLENNEEQDLYGYAMERYIEQFILD